jgi:hypothetical protein
MSALPFLKDNMFISCVPIASSTSKIANKESSSQHGADQILNSQIRTSNSDNIAQHWRALVLAQFHSPSKLEKAKKYQR